MPDLTQSPNDFKAVINFLPLQELKLLIWDFVAQPAALDRLAGFELFPVGYFPIRCWFICLAVRETLKARVTRSPDRSPLGRLSSPQAEPQAL